MNILLLEDNTTDADLTKRSLEHSILGCSVEIAPTLKKANEMLNKGILFDIALLDVQLPDGTGLDMLMEIRISGLKLPVIMITGSGNEEVVTTVLKAGADDYVIKRQGYVENLPGIIDFAVKNFHQKSQELKEIIDVLYIEYHSLDIDLTRRHMNQFAPYILIDFVATAEETLKQMDMNEAGTCKWKVILLDYLLPGINALEFIKIIRQERKLDIPIIMVTGQGSEDVALQALKLGANDYMVKRENYLFRLPLAILNAHQHSELIKKQAALVESESKYRLLADNSGDVIFVLDKDLNYTYISPAIKTLCGFEPDEVLRQNISETLTPESFKKATKTLHEILAKNHDNSGLAPIQKIIEIEMVCKDKTTVWTEVKASLITKDDNKMIRILGVSRDISARKLANDKLRKLSRAVDQSPTSVLITDLNGNIEYVNPKFSRISGYSFEDVKGKNPRILKSGNTTQEEYKQLWDTVLSGGEWYGEFLNTKKDGSLFWESASISPIRNEDGEITHFLSVKEDITERKKEHEELIAAKEKAEESDRLKSAFLANMSHEIRTPMNGILGFADLLKDTKLTGEEQAKYIGIIEKSGARMLNIINDIIDISKIEAGLMKLDMKETNINEQIEYIYTFFKPEVEAKAMKIFFRNALPAKEAIIKTDREMLYAILTNLVKNAIKFSNEGEIEIGYKMVETQCIASMQFYVKDTGIGIPKNRHEAIFERFIQADIANKMAHQGAGLGLSITKAYIEMLGGKIWVESVEGIGSTFYFTLPCIAKPRENGTVKNGIPAIEAGNMVNPEVSELKILIAEDDETSGQLISIYVRKFGGEIISVQNGREAVEACRNNTDIDLVLMDIQMPEMNGYEATRQIRQFNTKVIIIALTAFALTGDREKAIESGCNDYISKPVKKDELERLIQKYFRK